MSKNGLMKSIMSNSTYIPSTINPNTSNLNQNNPNFSMFTNFDNLEDDFDFFGPSISKPRPGRIIHQTTEQSIDKKGNKVIKTKTIREIDTIKNNNQRRIKKILKKNNSQKNYNNMNNKFDIKTYKPSIKKDFLRFSKNSARNEAQKQKELYSSPDFLEGSPFGSPKKNNNYEINRKNFNSNLYNYRRNESPGLEIISPVECLANYSSENDYEENNYFGSYDNKHNKNKKIEKKIKIIRNNIKNINYELEDPEGFDYLKNSENKGRNLSKNSKISQIILNKSEFYNNRNKLINNSYQSDFQSPDRNRNIQNNFRKVTDNMIDSKGPTNDDKKVTKIIRTKIKTNLGHVKIYKIKRINNDININKKRIPNNNNIKYLSEIEAAKIIQAWWRKRYLLGEEEVLDLAVKSAIKLQSNIRGFLVRKKVLKYITLAIYYQSFCDKLQDILCTHTKKNIMKLLKQKFGDNKDIKKIISRKKYSQENIKKNIINLNNSKSFISSIGYKSPQTYISPITYINRSNNKNERTFNNNTNNSMNITESSYQNDNERIKKNYSQYININNSFSKSYRINDINNNDHNTTIFKKIYIQGYNNKKMDNINIRNKISSKNSVRAVEKIPIKYKKKYTNAKNKKKNNEIENSKTTKTTTRVILSSNLRKLENNKVNEKYDYSQNEIMSGGTLSIIKLPNRRIKNSEYEDILWNIKETTEKRTYLTKKYEKLNEKINKEEKIEYSNPYQKIDNQISMEIIKSLPEKKNIIEINEKIEKYKKYYIKEKEKNKLNNLKHILKIVEYNKKSFLKKIFEKFRNNTIEKRNKEEKEKYEIENINDIEINKINKEKNDFMIQISPVKNDEEIQTINSNEEKINKFNKLFITENRNASFEGKKLNKNNNIIIANEKLNIISNIKKEDNGTQIGNWITKIDKNKNEAINILSIKPETLEKSIQYINLENESDANKEIKKWNPLISKINNDINIIQTKPEQIEEGSQYTNNIQNTIDKLNDINIIHNKPKLVDTEIQHEPEENQITKSEFDIISKLPKTDIGIQIEEEKNINKNNNLNQISKIKEEISIISKNNKPQKVDECTQYIKIENIIDKRREYKIITRKPDLIESGIQPEKSENKITNSELNIISKLSQEKEGKIWIKPWNPQISENNTNINILSSKPKMIEECMQYIPYENTISQLKELKIIHNKPELIDSEIQFEPEVNSVDKNLIIEIKGQKPQYKESITQYEKPINEIIKSFPLNIPGIKKEPKPKNNEIKIRTIKRSLCKMQHHILKKIWLRKAFKTFESNCKRPAYHKVILKELLRMYLLKWRFIKGYGPDRYGNIYDRNGILIRRIQGTVADAQIQHEFKIETEEQCTQYTPIENIISTLKQIEIGPSYKRKIEPVKNDIAIGDDNIIEECIQKNDDVMLKGSLKKKFENESQIYKNETWVIKCKEKILKEEGTDITDIRTLLNENNKIMKLEKINISGEEYSLKKKIILRKKELLTQMIYKKILNEKLLLCDSLRHWFKQTLLLLQQEQYLIEQQKKNYAEISQNEKFSIIEEIKKMEISTQIDPPVNAIENTQNINICNTKIMKNAEINVDFPYKFKKINPQKNEDFSYKYYKKTPVFKIEKHNDVNIYSEDYLFKEEIKKGIHHPITEPAKIRINEIFNKFINSRNLNKSLLRKFFVIWRRNANYLALLENAQIITDFCKNNFNRTKNYRKWKKLSEKLIINEKIKIIKQFEKIYFKKNKIFDLIRITRINTLYSKKRFVHYILLAWLIYTRNITKKKLHIKTLYESMLNTYINMTDDLFGNNQSGNPSVQDALYEAINTDKFISKNIINKDVPLAEDFYKNQKSNKPPINNINNITIKKEKEKKEYYIKKSIIPNNIKNYRNVEKKVIKIRENERLHSKGRGRKYRSQEEKQILDKFNDSRDEIYKNNIEYKKIKDEKENIRMNNSDININIYNSMKLNHDNNDNMTIKNINSYKKENNVSDKKNKTYVSHIKDKLFQNNE